MYRPGWKGTSMTAECIYEFIEKNYSEERRKHTFAVRDTAVRLAKHYKSDEKKAETAALFHDMHKRQSDIYHGGITADKMKSDYGIDDDDVLNAVRYHTTGRPGMSLLEKIIYIADVIEPGRDFPGVSKIRELAESDIDKACLTSMESTIEYINSKGLFLDENTVKAKNYLKEKGGSNEQ